MPPGAFPRTAERPRGKTAERETPPYTPPPLLPQNIMSLQGGARPYRKSRIKLTQPAMFSREGDDLMPYKLKSWFRELKKYLSKHDVDNDTENVVEFSGAVTEDRVHNA